MYAIKLGLGAEQSRLERQRHVGLGCRVRDTDLQSRFGIFFEMFLRMGPHTLHLQCYTLLERQRCVGPGCRVRDTDLYPHFLANIYQKYSVDPSIRYVPDSLLQ